MSSYTLQQGLPIFLSLGLIAILGYPIYEDYTTPKIVSAFYMDVSESNQKADLKDSLKKACKARLEALKEGDILINNKFAEVSAIPKTYNYSKQLLEAELLKDCDQVQQRPDELGKKKGTDLIKEIASIKEQVSKNGNRHAAMMIFVNANETVPNANKSGQTEGQFQSSNSNDSQQKNLEKAIEELSKIQGQVVIFVSDVKLFNNIDQSISKNVQIESHETAYNLIPQIHQEVRQQAKQK